MSSIDQRLIWSLPLTWVLEDKLGNRIEVDVEPVIHGLYDLGHELLIDGVAYRLVAKRGRMVVASESLIS